MSNILFLIIFTVVTFLILALGIWFFKKDAMFTIAIGAVIGANIYNATAYPIEISGIKFGIDSIVYTIFCFCLLVMYIDYGKKDMKIVLYTSMFSIFFSAFLAFMGGFSQAGYSTELLFNALSYICSIIGTYFAIIGMVWFYDFLIKKHVNKYVAVFMALLYAAIVNSFIYFGLSYLYAKSLGEEFLMTLLGSYIGKIIASLLCLIVLTAHLNKPKDEKETVAITKEKKAPKKALPVKNKIEKKAIDKKVNDDNKDVKKTSKKTLQSSKPRTKKQEK